MVYNSPEGIRVFDLATLKTRMLVTNPPAPANADASPQPASAAAPTPS
jgi:hypothetical protein